MNLDQIKSRLKQLEDEEKSVKDQSEKLDIRQHTIKILINRINLSL